MPKYDREIARLVQEKTGEEIVPGSSVVGFRDTTYRFLYVSQLPDGPSSGKVIAAVPCGHGPEDDHGYFCMDDGWAEREYYPGVLNARIEIMGVEE